MRGADPLESVLAESQRLGFLGPGPLGPHVAHAGGFVDSVPEDASRCLDLGSGGGIPGLVLAARRPALTLVLLDASRRRTEFLREAISRLGLEGRVEVVTDRAETAARHPDLRAGFDAVVARSFGPPAVTAECAVGFLRSGGVLVVSEPPGGGAGSVPERWPEDGLAKLGFGPAMRHETAAAGFVRIVRVEEGDRWPRRVGIPAKRPCWGPAGINP